MLGGCYVFYFYLYFALRSKIFSKKVRKSTNKNKRPNSLIQGMSFWDDYATHEHIMHKEKSYRLKVNLESMSSICLINENYTSKDASVIINENYTSQMQL